MSEFPSSRFFTMRNKHVEDEMQKVKNNTSPNTCDHSARFLTNIRVCVMMNPLPASSTSYWPLAAISSPSGSSIKTSLTCLRPPIMSSPRREAVASKPRRRSRQRDTRTAELGAGGGGGGNRSVFNILWGWIDGLLQHASHIRLEVRTSLHIFLDHRRILLLAAGR